MERNCTSVEICRASTSIAMLNLQTPEAKLLKSLRDAWSPAIGLNLHNQNSLTSAGRTGKQAAISFLVVYGDAAKTTSEGHERNKRLVSAMIAAIQPYMSGYIGKYSDEYTSTAFGDNFSAWGTPVILIETGALYGKDEMYLVKVNFVAFLTALNSIATGGEANQSPEPYLSLAENSSGTLVNFVFHNANIISSREAISPIVGDIAAVTERRRASFAAPTVIRGVGDIGGRHGLEEYDASGFTVFQRFGKIASGELAEFFFYKKDRVVDWKAVDVERQFP